MEKEPKKMWCGPWGYRESAAVVAGIVVVGWLLQLAVGGINFAYLGWPVNVFVGAIIVMVIAAFSLYRESATFRWISGVHLSVTLISALVILGIIMGMTPQFADHHSLQDDHVGLFHTLGFTSMTSSWAFVLVYLFTLVSLGCVIVKRICRFSFADYAFYLNHIGLWLVLFSAGIGAADMKRYVMHIREGEVEWRVYNDRGDVLELPVAIRLNDFDMEEYPPKLAVIDRVTGEALPEGKPAFFQIDEKKRTGLIGNWELIVEKYLHNAVRNSDSTYREVVMPGSTPAARVKVNNLVTGGTTEGWVCSGNIAQLYMVLNLDEDHSVVMTRPEPKRYISDIDIFTEEGKTGHALLEVNQPAKAGHWRLYQYGYDSDAGRMSTYSSIELVYDPWLVPVYIGIVMVAAGAVCMLWSGRGRKEERK